MILGLPWLKETNLTIDWTKKTLSISESLDQSKDLFLSHIVDVKRNSSFFGRNAIPPQHVNVNSITDSKLFKYNQWETESQFLTRANDNRRIHRVAQCGSRFLSPLAHSQYVTKITTATKLAIAVEATQPKQVLPPEYSDFTSVFSKEATDHVPPSQPYDHEINLGDSFVPKVGKTLPLIP